MSESRATNSPVNKYRGYHLETLRLPMISVLVFKQEKITCPLLIILLYYDSCLIVVVWAIIHVCNGAVSSLKRGCMGKETYRMAPWTAAHTSDFIEQFKRSCTDWRLFVLVVGRRNEPNESNGDVSLCQKSIPKLYSAFFSFFQYHNFSIRIRSVEFMPQTMPSNFPQWMDLISRGN